MGPVFFNISECHHNLCRGERQKGAFPAKNFRDSQTTFETRLREDKKQQEIPPGLSSPLRYGQSHGG